VPRIFTGSLDELVEGLRPLLITGQESETSFKLARAPASAGSAEVEVRDFGSGVPPSPVVPLHRREAMLTHTVDWQDRTIRGAQVRSRRPSIANRTERARAHTLDEPSGGIADWLTRGTGMPSSNAALASSDASARRQEVRPRENTI
jgi:hypothetical protein